MCTVVRAVKMTSKYFDRFLFFVPIFFELHRKASILFLNLCLISSCSFWLQTNEYIYIYVKE